MVSTADVQLAIMDDKMNRGSRLELVALSQVFSGDIVNLNRASRLVRNIEPAIRPSHSTDRMFLGSHIRIPKTGGARDGSGGRVRHAAIAGCHKRSSEEFPGGG